MESPRERSTQPIVAGRMLLVEAEGIGEVEGVA